MKTEVPVFLASASPRRREILTMLGMDFTVQVSDVDEKTDASEPADLVAELAKRKAEAVAAMHPENCLVIGSDTIVWKDGRVFGKPADREEAGRMLRSLADDTHMVYTGVCLLLRRDGVLRTEVLVDSAEVVFSGPDSEEIEWYLSTGEPMDKAGAYAIQGLGGRFVRGIRGDFYTVMGLPMSRLYEKLREIGMIPVNTVRSAR